MTILFMTGHHNMEINIFANLFMPTELFVWLQSHKSLSPAEAFVNKYCIQGNIHTRFISAPFALVVKTGRTLLSHIISLKKQVSGRI